MQNFLDFMFCFRFFCMQAAVKILGFPALVIIRIEPPALHRRKKIGLKLTARGHTVRVKIPEIKSSPLFTSHPCSASAKGAVGKKPSVFFQIKHGPVMASRVGWPGIKSGLPACGDFCNTAQGNKHKCLKPAVPLPPRSRIVHKFGNEIGRAHV